VIQLVGHLRRPIAADVAIEQIALDRLTEAGRSTGPIGLPAWREHQRAAEWKMRELWEAGSLQRDHVGLGRTLDARGFAVDGLQMIHDTVSFVSSSSNCARNAGLRTESSPYTLKQTSVQPRIHSQ
jgi:hypothetical protein